MEGVPLSDPRDIILILGDGGMMGAFGVDIHVVRTIEEAASVCKKAST